MSAALRGATLIRVKPVLSIDRIFYLDSRPRESEEPNIYASSGMTRRQWCAFCSGIQRARIGRRQPSRRRGEHHLQSHRGLCSSCMGVSHASRSRRGSERTPTAVETIFAMLAVFGRFDPHLSQIKHFRKRYRRRPARPAQDHARHDDSGSSSLMPHWPKGGIENADGRLRPWCPRHLDIDQTSDEVIHAIVLTSNLTPRQMPRVQDAIPSLACRASNGRSNPPSCALRFVRNRGGVKRAEFFRESLEACVGRPVEKGFVDKHRSTDVVSRDHFCRRRSRGDRTYHGRPDQHRKHTAAGSARRTQSRRQKSDRTCDAWPLHVGRARGDRRRRH